MNRSLPLLTTVVFIALTLIGCDNMRNGNRIKPYEESKIFDNGSSSQTLIEGTVAQGYLREDTSFYQGKIGDEFTAKNPMLAKMPEKDLIARGSNRFNIYCIVCHGSTAEGDGLVVQRGMNKPPSFYDDRVMSKKDGDIYNVITNGYGAMYGYKDALTPEDRWAVVAYIRWLQKLKTQE